MSIIRWCINNPVSVNLLVAFLCIAGLFSLSDIKREVFPAFSLDRVLITVPFPGANPEEIEEGICVKIEETLTGLRGVKKITSSARESMGVVVVEIETGENLERMKDDVETRINSINTFPRAAEKPVVTKLELIRHVLLVSVSGNVNEEVLRAVSEGIREDLLAFPEISQVNIQGLKEYEVSVEIAAARLREFGLTMEDIAKAVRAESFDLSGGTVRTAREEVLLRVKGQKYQRRDFEDIVIRTDPTGGNVYLHQVAQVHDGFADTRLQGSLGGQRSALVAVFKTEDEDTITIAQRVHAYIAEKQKTVPAGLHLNVFSDSSVVVRSRLDLLFNNGLQGLVLVFLCLWTFLSLRLSFWVTIGIPISMLGTFIVLNGFGQTLNMMSMFGLIMALGMIVDDAVVVSESVFQRLESSDKITPGRASFEGTVRVFWPILASVSTTVVAFLPLMFMSGIMGKFIMILPATVISCLLVSLIEGLIALPCHLAHSLPPQESMGNPGRVRKFVESCIKALIDGYTVWLRRACAYRYATIGIGIFILLVSIGFVRAGWVNFVLFAKGDSDTVLAKITFPEGTSFEVTEKAVTFLREKMELVSRELGAGALKNASGSSVIKTLFSLTGQHSGVESSLGSNLGEVTVELMGSEFRRVHSSEILRRWREAVGEVPGVRSLLFAEQERGPGGKPIEIQFRGTDFVKMQAAVQETKAHLRTYPGVFDVDDDFKSGLAEIRFDLKPSARHLGLTLNDLATQIRHAFYGNEAVRLQRGRFDVKVFLRLPQADRRLISTLDTMIVRTPTGAEIPLPEVAVMTKTDGTTLIRRADGQRIINVLGDLDETKANAEVILDKMVQSGFFAEVCRKYQVSYSLEGQKRETRESMDGLKKGFLLSLIGIYIILATVFSSYVQPIIIMMAIPFGIVGAIMGHLIMGYSLTMLSLFGLVALGGIVVNNSLLIIDFINEAQRQNIPLEEALIQAGRQRIRPILLTSVTTICGVSTLLLEKSFQAQFLIPMAITLAWGLFFSTAITLFLVPALYGCFADVLRLLFWIWEGRVPEDREILAAHDVTLPESPPRP
jgi:multidrug efflux pump subunit AcrB